MRARLIITTLLLTVATSLGASDLWIHVRVTEKGFKPTNVEINLPFRLIERLAPLIDEHQGHDSEIKFGHRDMDVHEFREVWNRLEQGEVVVEEDARLQLIDGARGEVLLIQDVDGHHGANVRVPADVIDALLSGRHDRFDMEAAVRALARHGEGELVSVTDKDATVKIWIDRSPEP